MPTHVVLQWCLVACWVLLVFAYGACLGSLINVVAYRRPRGESIVRPPSRCPNCQTRLKWKDNIPVFGWILLKGKCRYCKVRISPEYPIVEASVGLLFVLFYLMWYVPHGVHIGSMTFTPRWALFNAGRSWPEFVTLLVLIASLFAMTLVDAKTFTIPIELPYIPAVAALLIYPVHAAFTGYGGFTGMRATPGWTWAIASPAFTRWDLIGVAFGGVIGLGLGLILLWTGLVGRSMADYPEWEAQEKARRAAANASPGDATTSTPAPVTQEPPDPQPPASDPSAPASPASTADTSDPSMWMDYPHARREMIRELAFLAPCVMLMLAGWYAGRHWGGVTLDPFTGQHSAATLAPLWLTVLSGVLLGFLVGGGIVWAVRILGTLAFGREAMGLGDVHLMAGVGAALGWIDPILAFFGAAFVGLGWAVLGRVLGGKFQRMLPYGPFLAVSTVLVLLLKPIIEIGLSYAFHTPIRLP